MNYKEFGFILFVVHYKESIQFYRDVLKLPVRHIQADLTTFDLPHGYLMVEKGGTYANANEKRRHQNPTVIRFDVENIEDAVAELEAAGVSFLTKRLEFDWGTIAVFTDPDGHRIELGQLTNKSGAKKASTYWETPSL
ncbi:glyoxalase family protein [Bacillus sp. JCM 19046]|nr:glyoxalase family protein [Bacillus sp. JCM 19045]GAF18340.1 glyoxalase family protein [Bacillus sp. JCM 19046]